MNCPAAKSESCLQDDQQQFDKLYRRSERYAYQLACRLVSNKADAEDVTQEAYLRAWQHFGDYDRSRSFETWLLRILANIVVDRGRRQKNRPQLSLDNLVNQGSERSFSWLTKCTVVQDPEEICLQQMDVQRVRHALAALPAYRQEMVTLVDFEGYDYREAAELTGRAVGTVRSRLHRGRMQIRKMLEGAMFQMQDAS